MQPEKVNLIRSSMSIMLKVVDLETSNMPRTKGKKCTLRITELEDLIRAQQKQVFHMIHGWSSLLSLTTFFYTWRHFAVKGKADARRGQSQREGEQLQRAVEEQLDRAKKELFADGKRKETELRAEVGAAEVSLMRVRGDLIRAEEARAQTLYDLGVCKMENGELRKENEALGERLREYEEQLAKLRKQMAGASRESNTGVDNHARRDAHLPSSSVAVASEKVALPPPSLFESPSVFMEDVRAEQVQVFDDTEEADRHRPHEGEVHGVYVVHRFVREQGFSSRRRPSATRPAKPPKQSVPPANLVQCRGVGRRWRWCNVISDPERKHEKKAAARLILVREIALRKQSAAGAARQRFIFSAAAA
eukprot:g559.t1